ncbi:oligosaccharide flippase family protein [Amphibacillus jilinensis]|uniref:oligosaccharide flippase family protein n=1 Tax=Amphibacillus jilinensis TaxID=1216008 RepID=UPI0003044F22|nr:oligosaccharide flippase family protein [Amphibacillus jilinensis]
MVKQIKFGVIITYIGTLINLLTGLLITPITLRLFGQEEYGLYALAMSIMGMLFLFDFGFSNAVIKYATKFKEKNDEKGYQNTMAMFLLLYSIIGIILFVCAVIMSLQADKIFAKGLSVEEIERFKDMLIIVAINLAVSFPLKLFSGVIVAHERFIFSKVVNLIRFIVNPLTILSVLYMGYTSIVVLAAITIVSIFLSLLDVYYCIVILKLKIKLHKVDFQLLKEIASYSLWVFVAGLADIIYTRTDIFVLGALVNAREVAVYHIADVINSLFNKLTMVLSGFLLPKLVKMITNQVSNRQIDNIFIKISRIQFFLAALVITGFISVGHEFIVLWAGPDYHLAYWVALLIISSRFIPIVQVLATSILQAKNQHVFQSKLYLVVAVFNLLISIPLAMMYGVIGAAIGTVIGKIINTVVMNIYYVRIGIDMKRYSKEVFILFIPMVTMGLLGYLLKSFFHVSNMIDVFIFAVAFSVIYGWIMFRFYMNDGEKRFIINSYHKRFSKKEDPKKRCI